MHQRLLKEARLGASFDSVNRLFHIFEDKPFCPLDEVFLGSFRSVAVFRRLYEESEELIRIRSLK